MNYAIPILMYHQVTPRPLPGFRKYAVTPQMFAAQMSWLAMAGYVTIGLDALLEHRSGRKSLSSRAVIITFDDGFQDCVDHAAPLLQSHRFTAVFYLVTHFMGKTSRWMVPERGFEFPLMSWAVARRLEAAGFQCGSHTMTHRRLAGLSPEDCREELLASRQVLEDELGHEVRHLAYPHGSFNERVRAIAEETGYRSSCSTRFGLSTADDDPLALQRVPVFGHDTLPDFICRLRTAQTLGEWLYGKAQDLRKRLRREENQIRS